MFFPDNDRELLGEELDDQSGDTCDLIFPDAVSHWQAEETVGHGYGAESFMVLRVFRIGTETR